MLFTLRLFVVCLFFTHGFSLFSAEPTAPVWWKGNIHTHSLWSDGNDFPEMIADWYRERDYNFLALSDHNILSQGQRWMKSADITKRGGSHALEKYIKKFGTDWVEQRTSTDKSDTEIRLKPFSEYRALMEERGKFLMIPAEEISDSVGGLPVHMNATNLGELIQPLGGETVTAAIEANMRAANTQAKRLGREILVHLNHPNFGYGVSAEDLAHAVSEKFFEIYNGHPDVKQLGDATHPNLEQLWDIANTIRLEKLDSAPLFGVATDDSHHYHGGNVSPGRGWIMVRASHLTPETLIRAMKRGDFYASSGVRLKRVGLNPSTNVLELEIDGDKGVQYTTQFVGTRKDIVLDASNEGLDAGSEGLDAGSDEPDATGEVPTNATSRIGMVFLTAIGEKPRYQLDGTELYVRAIVTSSRKHPNPSFKDQMEAAWTQPIGWSIAK